MATFNSVQTEISTDGTLQTINLGIEYIDKENIIVSISTQSEPLVEGVGYTWNGDFQIILTDPVPIDESVTVRRSTVSSEILNTFAPNAAFLRESLDENFKQILYIAQETADYGVVTDFYNEIDLHLNKIINLQTPTIAYDAANKGYVDTTMESFISVLTDLVNYIGSSDFSLYFKFNTTINEGDTTCQIAIVDDSYIINTAELYLGGVYQQEGTDYIISSLGLVTFNEPVEETLSVNGKYGTIAADAIIASINALHEALDTLSNL